jgi:hypothetical protein
MKDLRSRNDMEIGFVDPYIVFKDPLTSEPKLETSNGEESHEVLHEPKGQKIDTLPLQLQVSVVIVCTFYFTYSIQHIDIYVDSIVNELLYACVCIYKHM